jgi:hypothetical protein
VKEEATVGSTFIRVPSDGIAKVTKNINVQKLPQVANSVNYTDESILWGK